MQDLGMFNLSLSPQGERLGEGWFSIRVMSGVRDGLNQAGP